jgi:hypothetical protein
MFLRKCGYIEVTKDTLQKLLNSKELKVYYRDTFLKNNDCIITFFVILVNEKGERFLVMNNPFDDGTCWEIDRLAISMDSDYENKKLQLMGNFNNPKLKFYREYYQISSRIYKGKIDNVEADIAFTIEDSNQLLLVICSDGALLELRQNTNHLLDDLHEIDIRTF